MTSIENQMLESKWIHDKKELDDPKMTLKSG